MNKKPAFTLLELIVTVSIFSVVVTIATVSMVSTTKLQQQYSQTNQVNDQLNLAIQMIKDDVSRSSKVFSATIYANSNTAETGDLISKYPLNNMLITYSISQSDGVIAGADGYPEIHVYCAEKIFATSSTTKVVGQRLVKFINRYNTKTATPDVIKSALYSTAPRTYQCSESDLGTITNIGAGDNTHSYQYLTSPETQIDGLHFWPVWLGRISNASTSTYNNDADAVRMEINADYNPTNNPNSGVEIRASDQAQPNNSPQITLRALLSKNYYD